MASGFEVVERREVHRAPHVDGVRTRPPAFDRARGPDDEHRSELRGGGEDVVVGNRAHRDGRRERQFVWARASTASAAAPANSRAMIWIRMRLSHRVTRPACLDTRGVDLDGHARLQQVDREHEPPFGRLLPDEQAFDADERTLDDADAIAMVEVHVREDRHARAEETLDGVDFVRGDRRQPRPPPSRIRTTPRAFRIST